MFLFLLSCLGLSSAFRRGLFKSFLSSALVVVGFSFDVLALDDPPALKRFDDALTVLVDLDKNFDAITKGNGDNIRRQIGKVYAPPACTNPLCSFDTFVTKFVRSHPDDLDVDTFEGPIAEVQEAINQADFLAYSSIFSEYGNGGNGEDFLSNTHAQIKRAAKNMKVVVADLKSQAAK